MLGVVFSSQKAVRSSGQEDNFDVNCTKGATIRRKKKKRFFLELMMDFVRNLPQ